jgi:TrmH family RNA methyltransferase
MLVGQSEASMPTVISSLQNSRVKDLLKLTKHSERQRRRVTIAEGERECVHALRAGLIPLEAYISPALLTPQGIELVEQLSRYEAKRQTQLFEVTSEVFAKIAYRGDSGGILLLIPYLIYRLCDFDPSPPAFITVIEGVEKPGNLGAILRTADATAAQAVIVTAGATDIHNPNVIRASLGALFTVPVIESPSEETIQWLQHRKIQIVAATPETSQLYTDIDYKQPSAIVMGSEAHGLGALWRSAANALVTIPMLGMMDSLNLSTSTALMLYEVIRQRRQ